MWKWKLKLWFYWIFDCIVTSIIATGIVFFVINVLAFILGGF